MASATTSISNQSNLQKENQSQSSTQLNSLANEKSPYLRQHASNPVQWMPWCDEAIQQAKILNKPIFLSIGYSTCHWCHVMERESFSNPTIAALMNELFVNIKVDREERPDIDDTYMTIVTSLNDGHGGWPLSVWLTPDLTVISGATYFPPQDTARQPGFPTICRYISRMWEQKEQELREQGKTMQNLVNEHIQGLASGGAQPQGGPDSLTTHGEGGLGSFSETADQVRSKLLSRLLERFDDVFGGYGSAPKFPRPTELNFAISCASRYDAIRRQKQTRATNIATDQDRVQMDTTEAEAQSGIGGGGELGHADTFSLLAPSVLEDLSQYLGHSSENLSTLQLHRSARLKIIAKDISKRLALNGIAARKALLIAESSGRIRMHGTQQSDIHLKMEGYSAAEKALASAWFTLRRMMAGGMYDALGGGFHRYSVDPIWQVPHFEKMLYDQAGITLALLDTYLATADTSLAHAARSTLDYLIRDMQHPDGGIYAAEDADSANPPEMDAHGRPTKPNMQQESSQTHEHGEKREGAFYVWTYEEISRILNLAFAEERDLGITINEIPAPLQKFRKHITLPQGITCKAAIAAFSKYYTIHPEGNVDSQSDPQNEFTNQNVFIASGLLSTTLRALQQQSQTHMQEPGGAPAEVVEAWTTYKGDRALHVLSETLSACREALRLYRDAYRPRPHLDNKIVTAWNGLTMAAFARAAQILPLQLLRDGIHREKRHAKMRRDSQSSQTSQTSHESIRETSEHFEYTPHAQFPSDFLPPHRSATLEELAKTALEAAESSHKHPDDSACNDPSMKTLSKADTAYLRATSELETEHRRYIDVAKKIASFVKQHLTVSCNENRNEKYPTLLLRSFCDGPGNVHGFAEDYSSMIYGLLELYQACGEVEYLHWAVELQKKQDELFYDTEHGGYFMTSSEASSTNTYSSSFDVQKSVHFNAIRSKSIQDGAEPSANSLAVINLLRLSALTGNDGMNAKALRTLRLFRSQMSNAPVTMPLLATAYDAVASSGSGGHFSECVIAGPLSHPLTRGLMYAAMSRYSNHRVVAFVEGGEGQKFLSAQKPALEGMRPRRYSYEGQGDIEDNMQQHVIEHAIEGGRPPVIPQAYICWGQTCSPPTDDAAKVAHDANFD